MMNVLQLNCCFASCSVACAVCLMFLILAIIGMSLLYCYKCKQLNAKKEEREQRRQWEVEDICREREWKEKDRNRDDKEYNRKVLVEDREFELKKQKLL